MVHGHDQQDIQDVIAAFAQAAKDAQRIGMDGVEIHGAHGYWLTSSSGKAATSVPTNTVAAWPTARALPLN